MKFLKRLFGSAAPETVPVAPKPPKGDRKQAQTTAPKSARKAPPEPDEAGPLAPDFAALDLPDELNRAIRRLGFTSCTPVQKEVLPHALDGKDIIAQAQTGTGKTAAFLISAIAYHLENPEVESRGNGTPFALAIAPTRELAMQIAHDADLLAKFTRLRIATVVGGIDYDKQRKQLAGPVDIVIATPGRLLDFARSRVIDLSHVETLIIDEADRMLSMGFIPDVKDIIKRTPRKENRQTQLFSATFSEDIRRLAAQWTIDPVEVSIDPEQVAVDSVEQRVYLTSAEQKYNVLYNLIMSDEVDRIIVFVNRRDQTRSLADRLHRNGIECGLLTGEVPQKKRISTLNKFKSGEVKVLVATDVAGRGIHVDDISHVVNYTLPEDPEDYIHRIGRTGRAGATGVSIALACEDDAFMLPGIEQLLGEPLECVPPPAELLQAPPAPVRRSPEREFVEKRPRDKPRGRGR
ncbi:MAG: DEAD/DEAH box helicase [Pseudomonadota bacterium]